MCVLKSTCKHIKEIYIQWKEKKKRNPQIDILYSSLF